MSLILGWGTKIPMLHGLSKKRWPPLSRNPVPLYFLSTCDIAVDLVETHYLRAQISRFVHQCFLTVFVKWTLLRFDKVYSSVLRKDYII